jgi:hypothetical protein
MPEVAFLDAVTAFLAGPAGLSPAPGTVGFGIPVSGATLPLLSLSLATVNRLDIGLGGGLTEVSQGALPVTATIDLAQPVLPGPEPLQLLDPTRRLLTLPHGGLVRADGLDSPLGPVDIVVTVAGQPRSLTAGVPGPTQYAIDPLVGQLAFGAALPAVGAVVARYNLGIWERSTTLIDGTLDLGIWDTDLGRLGTISAAAVRALLGAAGGPLPGLRRIALTSLGEVTAPQTAAPLARMRPARFGFQFEHIVDAPASSGGIIRRVPITSRLTAFLRDPASGALVETLDVETET